MLTAREIHPSVTLALTARNRWTYDVGLFTEASDELSRVPSEVIDRLGRPQRDPTAVTARVIDLDLCNPQLPRTEWEGLVRAVAPAKHIIELTLELRFEPRENHGNPWQCVRAYYHPSWVSYGLHRPRKSLSLEGFIRKYLKNGDKLPQETMDKFLRDTYTRLFNQPTFEELDGGYDFEVIPGNTPNSASRFVEVYTHDYRQSSYSIGSPAVHGSCMRYEPSEMDLSEDSAHPVESYCHEESTIGLAILKAKSDGCIISRTLVNMETKKWLRVYRGAPLPDYEVNLEKYVDHTRNTMERHLIEAGYSPGGRSALDGCLLRQWDEDIEGRPVVPYLDGNQEVYYISGKPQYWLMVGQGDRLAGTCSNYCPPVLEGAELVECFMCGERYHDDDTHYYEYLTRCWGYDEHDVAICTGCYEEHIASCVCCGEAVVADQCWCSVNEAYYCSSCAEERLEECSYCGSDAPKGTDLCHDCYGNVGRCITCDEYTEDTNEDGEYQCDSCKPKEEEDTHELEQE
jgi:hypothetical protein